MAAVRDSQMEGDGAERLMKSRAGWVLPLDFLLRGIEAIDHIGCMATGGCMQGKNTPNSFRSWGRRPTL